MIATLTAIAFQGTVSTPIDLQPEFLRSSVVVVPLKRGEWPWLYALSEGESTVRNYAGRMRTVDFHLGRVVVDLVQDRLVHIPVRGRSAVVSSLSRLIRTPFEDREGSVWIGSRPEPEWATYEGAELLEYGGRATREWLTIMDRPASERLQIVGALPADLLENNILIRLQDGTNARVLLKTRNLD